MLSTLPKGDVSSHPKVLRRFQRTRSMSTINGNGFFARRTRSRTLRRLRLAGVELWANADLSWKTKKGLRRLFAFAPKTGRSARASVWPATTGSKARPPRDESESDFSTLDAAVISLHPDAGFLALPPSPHIPRRPTIRYFIATAYSVEGTGASGKWSHPGTVAADRSVLPLNSRIRIYGAARYSGDYTVEDTGGEGGRPSHRHLCAQPGRSKKVRASASKGGLSSSMAMT